MAKPLFIILLLLPSLALVGSDFERVVHYEVDRNSKTVTLWHEEKSSVTCRMTLDSEVVGPIELLERRDGCSIMAVNQTLSMVGVGRLK